MKCIMCENKVSLKKQRIKMKYKQCGLSNVTLNGVEYYKCNVCGEEYYGFGDQEKLHSIIAQVLILKKGLFTGKEMRFLRTYLGYSASMLARMTGYTKETLSRFENDKKPISKSFDVLVRALVATKLPDRKYDLHDFLLGEKGKTLKLIELDAKKDGWHLKQAA